MKTQTRIGLAAGGGMEDWKRGSMVGWRTRLRACFRSPILPILQPSILPTLHSSSLPVSHSSLLPVFLLPVFLLLAPRAEATDYTTTQSGNWNANATWGGSGYPNAATDNAIISANHTVTVAQAGTSYTVSNLTVNGVLTHTANSTVAATPYYTIDLTVLGALNVAAGGMIDAKGKGFSAENGPGAASRNNCAASHGGQGSIQTTAGTTTYGSITNPTTLGSGGSGTGCNGGGAIILRVTGVVTNDGIIRADANPAGSYHNGAAGGSVNLAAASLGGVGTITANGNLSGDYNGSGGGGRVAVRLTSGTDFGGVTIRAFGGGSGGAAGTVYRQTSAQAAGQGDLVVDAGGIASSVATLISTNVTDRQIATLIITNSGVFNIASNVAFTMTSNFLNYAQTVPLCATGGTFVVGGSGTMTFGGTVTTNRFYNFTCTNAGKRIVFPSGSSNRLDGVLTLQGAAGNLLRLESSGAAQWKLVVPSPWAGSVSYVDVTNCYSYGGAQIQAYDSLGQYANNSNWNFLTSAPATNTWTGGSTDWGTAANWDQGHTPGGAEIIRITTANSPPNWPILNDHTILRILLLETGARLSLGTKNLTVQTNMVMTGILVASGTETVTLQGDANWAGGTFTNASSTVVIGGTGQQALDFSGIAFNTLLAQNANALTLTGAFSAVAFTNTGGARTFAGAITAGSFVNSGGALTFQSTLAAGTFANSGGALAFSNNVTAGSFSSTSGNLTFGGNVAATNFSVLTAGATMTFKAGGVYAITNLWLSGSGTNRMVLVSSLPGTKWDLNVSGVSYVSGVTVSDSNAGGGQPIRPVASSEGTPLSTVNWIFDGLTWKVWIGGSTDFHASGNWNPAGIPGPGDNLLIERTNGISAPVQTVAVTNANLTIGGLGPASLTLQAPMTVTNSVRILPQGLLTHSANSTVAATPYYKVDLTIGGSLAVASGGAIKVKGRGFQTDNGPGAASRNNYAASHGGLGTMQTADGNPTYGSITNPITLGSGGGGPSAGYGGGAIILKVSGAASLEGALNADAGDMEAGYQNGAAGGSVNLAAATLSGAGWITANGNTNSADNGGGGGGRVALKLTAGTDVGGVAVRAFGGVPSGAPGTIYLQMAGQADGAGALIVDAGGSAPQAGRSALISTNVTDATVGDVLIRNSASFAMASNTAMSVAGSWSNAATFTAASNSVVNLAKTNTATVYGQSTFQTLTITNDSLKTVYFQAGRTNWVNGALLIRNAALRSTADGTQWHLRLAASATQDVTFVQVRDSNATNGQTIVAQPQSQDLGNNVNWIFRYNLGTVFKFK